MLLLLYFLGVLLILGIIAMSIIWGGSEFIKSQYIKETNKLSNTFKN